MYIFVIFICDHLKVRSIKIIMIYIYFVKYFNDGAANDCPI